jgi:tRNA A-37 threonylcarbamoyl transferase component Bud32
MSDLKLLTTGELKKILKEASRAEYDKTDTSTSQEQLIAIIKRLFKEIDNRTFIKLRKLGVPGKDGTVWAVKYKPPDEKRNPGVYALKQFKPSKSSKKILLESELQSEAAQNGISPKIIDTDIFGKFIVMDLLPGETLFDILKKSAGVMSLWHQKELVELIKKLDKISIYHGDPSPLNFVAGADGKLKVIDFGFARKMREGESLLNQKYMLLGFILKMKEMGVDVNKNYTYIKKNIDSAELSKCGIQL